MGILQLVDKLQVGLLLQQNSNLQKAMQVIMHTVTSVSNWLMLWSADTC